MDLDRLSLSHPQFCRAVGEFMAFLQAAQVRNTTYDFPHFDLYFFFCKMTLALPYNY